MGRRSDGLLEVTFDVASRLPWYLAVALAIGSYLFLHSVAVIDVPPATAANPIPSLQGHLFKQLATIFQYILPSVFLLAAAVSAFRRQRARRLHADVARGASLRDLTWQEFEALVGEAFRARGYTVVAGGKSGPDGGVDVVLTKGGEKFLVQCKQWRALKVGVDVVRELYGVMTAKDATGGFIATSGAFTQEARKFVDGLNIELLDGQDLTRLIKPIASSTSSSANLSSPVTCPVCRSAMVKRVARKGVQAGRPFWGCSRFPDCRGTLPIG